MLNWLGFERRVAVRFLREGRMQTLLIIVGVAAGVAVVAYISALITGLQRNTLEKTLGAQAHVTVSARRRRGLPARAPAGGIHRAGADAAARAATAHGCQLAVAGAGARGDAGGGGGVADGFRRRPRAARRGIEVDRADGRRPRPLRPHRAPALQGRAGRAAPGPGEGIIGRELADDLGVRVGDRISLVTGTITDSLRVTALVDLGVRELNRRTVIVPLRAAQSLVGLPGGATGLDLAWSMSGSPTPGQRPVATLPLQGRELAGGEFATGLGAECAIGEHGADPRRGDGRGGARHRQRARGLGGAEAARDRHPARHRRDAGQMLRVFLLQGAIVGALGSTLGVLLAVG
jgi:lipoprotein-releasing system permease protein